MLADDHGKQSDPWVQLHIEQPIHPYVLPAVLALLAAVVGLWFLTGRGAVPTRAPPPSTKPKAGAHGKRVFTREEVARHNKREDCWLIVDHKVYDVTEYVEEHPGEDAILRNAGGDSTKGFHGPQHPTRVTDHIEEYHIGDLATP